MSEVVIRADQERTPTILQEHLAQLRVSWDIDWLRKGSRDVPLSGPLRTSNKALGGREWIVTRPTGAGRDDNWCVRSRIRMCFLRCQNTPAHELKATIVLGKNNILIEERLMRSLQQVWGHVPRPFFRNGNTTELLCCSRKVGRRPEKLRDDERTPEISIFRGQDVRGDQLHVRTRSAVLNQAEPVL